MLVTSCANVFAEIAFQVFTVTCFLTKHFRHCAVL